MRGFIRFDFFVQIVLFAVTLLGNLWLYFFALLVGSVFIGAWQVISAVVLAVGEPKLQKSRLLYLLLAIISLVLCFFAAQVGNIGYVAAAGLAVYYFVLTYRAFQDTRSSQLIEADDKILDQAIINEHSNNPLS